MLTRLRALPSYALQFSVVSNSLANAENGTLTRALSVAYVQVGTRMPCYTHTTTSSALALHRCMPTVKGSSAVGVADRVGARALPAIPGRVSVRPPQRADACVPRFPGPTCEGLSLRLEAESRPAPVCVGHDRATIPPGFPRELLCAVFRQHGITPTLFTPDVFLGSLRRCRAHFVLCNAWRLHTRSRGGMVLLLGRVPCCGESTRQGRYGKSFVPPIVCCAGACSGVEGFAKGGGVRVVRVVRVQQHCRRVLHCHRIGPVVPNRGAECRVDE